ncbi:hypothetical protein [Qipengyuania sp. ASV99]|uniref:hypothetical protein n=1 Tax=Qipengyuania sp. ASV99 TaxID=3399681 RepID=UPI003A4C7888
MTDKKVEEFLSEAIIAYRKLPKDISVGVSIEGISGRRVLPLDADQCDVELVQKLCAAAANLIGQSKEIPIKTGRVNELGNNIEEPLLDACRDIGLNATWPKRADGSGGRSGYPDIAIDIDGERPAYLEAKVIAEGTEASSFRSFYLSPSDNPKVCVDARHLLLAFTHERRENSAEGLEQYALTSFKLVDLYKVKGKIKFEYQSNNKEMYLKGAVIATG